MILPERGRGPAVRLLFSSPSGGGGHIEGCYTENRAGMLPDEHHTFTWSAPASEVFRISSSRLASTHQHGVKIDLVLCRMYGNGNNDWGTTTWVAMASYLVPVRVLFMYRDVTHLSHFPSELFAGLHFAVFLAVHLVSAGVPARATSGQSEGQFFGEMPGRWMLLHLLHGGTSGWLYYFPCDYYELNS